MYCYYYTSNSLKSKFSKQQKNVFRLNKQPVDIILIYIILQKGIRYVSSDKLLGRDQT